jgi:hypothetical protein
MTWDTFNTCRITSGAVAVIRSIRVLAAPIISAALIPYRV